MRLRTILVALCVLLVLTPALPAWNEVGHMLAAKLAYRKLNAAEKERVVAILKKHPHYEDYLSKGRPEGVDEGEWMVMRAATWPDWVRTPKNFHGNPANHPRYKFHRPYWHYINYPYKAGAEDLTIGEPLHASTDVTRQLPNCAKIVKGETTEDAGRAAEVTDDQNRAVRLCWLIHLTEDLHQPLHVAALVDETRLPGGDHGGNYLAVRASESSSPTNLHSFWDGLLGTDSHYATLTSLATTLTADYPESGLSELNDHTTLKSWAQESYTLAVNKAYQKGELPIVLYEDYQNHNISLEDVPIIDVGVEREARKTAERQMVLCGFRLAKSLKEATAE